MPDAAPLPLIVIAGPTGSGKSELALRLAQEFDAEIVNCDSLQVYRYLNIGTAKLPPSERLGIPHHLIDILNPDEVFTAGEYARRARSVIAGVSGAGKLPILAGGTGFYIRALLDGLFPGPTRDEEIRKRLFDRESRRAGSLHRILSRLDPAASQKIHAADRQKLIRALEIILSTRRPLSSWFRERRDALEGYRVLKIGLNPPRRELYDQLDRRAAAMFESGLIEEVRGILALGYPESSKALEAIGYREALQVIAGQTTIQEAVCKTQLGTRHYAKRQGTWFRSEPGMHWIDGFGNQIDAQDMGVELIGDFLENPSMK